MYDFAVIDLMYASSRIAGVPFIRQQVEAIVQNSQVWVFFEPLKVSGVIEILNHIHCVDYILDHVMEPLNQKLIRRRHHILITDPAGESRIL